jgi:hypothetical protein
MPVPAPDDKIKSRKQFVEWNDELTDTEAQAAMAVIVPIQSKYANRPNTVANLEELRDEVLTKLMECNILAEFDPSPCFHGEPPILELRGKIATDSIHKYGFDHEKKQYEVLKARDRGEDYLGEKERPDSRKVKDKPKKADGGA